MENWRRELKFDPLPPLLSSGKKALEYYARRDLLGEPSGPPRVLWNLPEAKRVLAGQQPDGGWKSRGVEKHPAINYRLTSEYARPLEPDRSRPFSHNWTGMVLRAFAAHPVYRKSEAARTAARLLKSRFFQPDCYSSYRAAGYWVRFDYPFWWNNLVAALNSLSLIGLPVDDGRISESLEWLIAHQEADGLWRTSYAGPGRAGKVSAASREKKLWVSLAICRVLKRFLGISSNRD